MIAALLTAAAVAHLSANNPLIWLDPAKCVQGAGGPVMPKKVLIGEIMKAYKAYPDVEAFEPNGPQRLLERIATASCPEGTCKPADAPYKSLQSAASDIVGARRSARYELRWVGDGPEPDIDSPQSYRAFYDMSRPTYELRCRGPETAPARPKGGDKPSVWQGISIAATTADMDKEFAKRDPAKLSYRVDEAKDEDAATVKVAVMSPPVLSHAPSEASPNGWNVRLFTAYDRLTADDPAKAVNNLDFGARAVFTLDPAGVYPWVFGLEGAWQSDDGLHSSLWRGEFYVSPPLQATFLDATGYGREKALAFLTPAYSLRFGWNARLLVDHVNVEDPGRKPGLVGKKSYTRGGYDADWGFRIAARPSDPAWGLSLSYKYRDDWSGRGAAADRVNAKLQYFPAQESRFVFGLEWDRGEDLTSFSRVENLLFTLGYRQ